MPLCDRDSAIYRNYVATLTSPTSCQLTWEFQNVGTTTWSSWSANLSIYTCPDGWLQRPSPAVGCAQVGDKLLALAPTNKCSNPGVGDPIYPLTGVRRETVETGIALGGVPLTLTYTTAARLQPEPSSMREPPSFGPLWRTSFHHKLLVVGANASALLSRGDGDLIYFDGGGTGFTVAGNIPHRLAAVSGGYLFSDAATGTLEMFDTAGRLQSLTNAGGMTLTFSYNADGSVARVTSSDGRVLTFSYSNGVIAKITAPDGGKIVASYDQQNNLSALVWQDGKALSFAYESSNLPWAMTGKVDENNSRYANFGYDVSGRATSTVLADGADSYSVTYGTPPVIISELFYDSTRDLWLRTMRWQAGTATQVTTSNGTVSTMGSQVIGGMPALTDRDQPAGSGCAASTTSHSYDGARNFLSRDDFNGTRTCYAYDPRNREILRIEGLSNTTSCSSIMGSNGVLPTTARKITTTWHNDWNFPMTVTEPLKKTTFVYHGQPDPFNNNATASCSSAPTRVDGKPAPVLCKKVEQALLPVTGGAAGPADDNFDKVTLLLHGEGSAGGAVVTDSSASGLTPTANAGVTTDTGDFKYGSASLLVPAGGGEALTYYANRTGLLLTGDFTVEGYFKVATAANWTLFVFRGQSTDAFNRVFFFTDGAGRLLMNRYGLNSVQFSASTSVIPVNTWFHLAFVRSGSTITCYIDGVAVGSVSDGGTFGNNGGGLDFERSIGVHMDEFRVTKGLARYTGNFVPPVSQFADRGPEVRVVDTTVPARVTSYSYDNVGHLKTYTDPRGNASVSSFYPDTALTGGAYDLYMGNVVLLLHGDANGSTAITDSSLSERPIATAGNAALSTAQSKFGGSSIAFDGSGAHLSIPSTTDLSFGSADFTIEMFVYKNANSSSASRIWNPDGDYYDGVSLGIDAAGNFAVYASTNGTSWTYSLPVVTNLQNGRWYHLAVVRSGGSLLAFVDGAKYVVTTALGSTPLYADTTHAHVIGAQSGSVSRPFNGYVDEFRITNGVARYTDTFTVPASAFPNSGPDKEAVGHTRGDLQSSANAAGQVTQYTLYDPAGRLRQMVDPKGITTDIAYTPRGLVSTVSVTPPAGSPRTTSYTYDNVGQLTQVNNPDGTTLTYTYDAAHRLTGISDARGNSVTYTLDASGNRIGEQISDRSGSLMRTINRIFDALNRVQQVTGAAQ